jgi:hypothetical protein
MSIGFRIYRVLPGGKSTPINNFDPSYIPDYVEWDSVPAAITKYLSDASGE